MFILVLLRPPHLQFCCFNFKAFSFNNMNGLEVQLLRRWPSFLERIHPAPGLSSVPLRDSAPTKKTTCILQATNVIVSCKLAKTFAAPTHSETSRLPNFLLKPTIVPAPHQILKTSAWADGGNNKKLDSSRRLKNKEFDRSQQRVG